MVYTCPKLTGALTLTWDSAHQQICCRFAGWGLLSVVEPLCALRGCGSQSCHSNCLTRHIRALTSLTTYMRVQTAHFEGSYWSAPMVLYLSIRATGGLTLLLTSLTPSS